ncbi:MAG: T9SS type A sorting domain-containing protein [Calditrichaeota bacterium]|nr:T9SS type A sorting domain-containing protein [Calditrichota bacterium]
MKFLRVLSVLTLAFLLMGADSEPIVPTAQTDAKRSEMRVEVVRNNVGRDDADEIIFSEDFEDGAEGWTFLDFTDLPEAWHKSDFNEMEEDNLLWWCGDTLQQYDGDPVGYDNRWMQWLDSPPLDLSEAGDDIALSFDGWWLLEDPRLHPPPDPYDGWDGWLVMISTDGGDEFEPLIPESPDYHSERLSSAERVWDMPEIPGWVFYSTEDEWPDTTAFTRPEVEWVNCVFDLSDYRSADIVVRFILFSDNSVAAPYNNVYLQESGVCIDNIVITDGDTDFLVNNADDEPIPEDGELIAGVLNEPSGNPWEIADEDGHESDHSAHCPIEENLIAGIISPPLEIPGEGWYTYFDFWVLCNTQMANSDTINDLEDLFDIQISTNLHNWTRVIYDYGADDDHADFYEDWGYYGPDVWFQTGDPNNQGHLEWQWKLNLTAWAGETVYLCWRMITDDVMDDPQGSGLWIDDFRLISSEARENDVGIQWLHLDYPNSIGIFPEGEIDVKNFGMLPQNTIRKYFKVDNGRTIPIMPWVDPLESDSSRIYNFRLPEIDYADMATLTVWTNINEDENTENDISELDFHIYPEGIYLLGYDNRTADDLIRFPDLNTGPAVLFTPGDDGVDSLFDIQAIDVQWDDQGIEEEVEVTLKVFSDSRGNISNELHSEDIIVSSGQQRINLSEVDALKDLNIDFWVYFNINHEDNLPLINGRVVSEGAPNWGEEHFYLSDGEDADEVEFEFQIQALITSAGAPDHELTPGRDEIVIEDVEPDSVATVNLMIYGSGSSPTTIESVELSNDIQFDVYSEDELPIELGIGEYAQFYINFAPTEEEYWFTDLTFHCSDDYEISIRISGRSSNSVDQPDEAQPLTFGLDEPYPNPFNNVTTLRYSLETAGFVTLSVYDLSGRKQMTLVNNHVQSGVYTMSLNAENLPSGVYLIKLENGSQTAVRKMALIR